MSSEEAVQTMPLRVTRFYSLPSSCATRLDTDDTCSQVIRCSVANTVLECLVQAGFVSFFVGKEKLTSSVHALWEEVTSPSTTRSRN